MKYGYIHIIFLVLISCHREDLGCHEESLLGTFESAKMIQIEKIPDANNFDFQVVSGNKIVFTLNHCGPQCDKVYDDEWAEQVVFQIEGNPISFAIEDIELEEASCLYRQLGAWVNQDRSFISRGSIHGEKISEDEWSIKLRIEFPEPNKLGARELRFNGVFEIRD